MSKYIATLNSDNIVVSIQQALDDFVLGGNQMFIGALDNELLGKRYEDDQFKPVVVIEPEKPGLITLGFFMLRLTQTERIAIRKLAKKETENGEIALDFMKLLESQSIVNTKQPQVRDGINFLELIGELDEGRAVEILDAPITDEQRP
jgi:hypothetical protein